MAKTIANHLARQQIEILQGVQARKSFEHFILMELMAYLGLNALDSPINYWRSKSGLEVDFILNNGTIAIEVKITEDPKLSDLKGLNAFCDDYTPEHALVVCPTTRKKIIKTNSGVIITILPWQEFLENLWARKYEVF